jgi:MerR family copper efflux transcriptional regulator
VGLSDQPARECVQVRDIAQAHLLVVRQKLAELQALETSLSRFVCSCDSACAGGPVADCTIVEDLAKPATTMVGPGAPAPATRSCCS